MMDWTPPAVAELTAMREASGFSYQAAADRFGVSVNAIHKKLKKLALGRGVVGRPLWWTDERTAKLRDLAAAKASIRQAAHELETSRRAIKRQATALGLDFGTRTSPAHGANPWTEADLSELDRLWVKGTPVAIIAEQLDRSTDSIYAKAKARNLLPRTVTTLSAGGIHRRSQAYAAKPLAGAPMPVDLSFARPWTERVDGEECAAPAGGVGADMFSCCAPVAPGQRYCGPHWNLFHERPRNWPTEPTSSKREPVAA